MHPSFEQFDAALRAPGTRADIGLEISDADATALLSNEGWSRDYYARWIAMFPAPSAIPPSAIASSAPGDPGGQRLGTAPVLALIAVIVVLVGVAAVALIIPTLTHTNIASALTSSDDSSDGTMTPSTSASATPTPSPSPTDLYGLSPALYEYMDASLALEGTSLAQAVAKGQTVSQVQALSTTLSKVVDLECTAIKSLPKGFDTPGTKDSEISSFEKGFSINGKTYKATSEQAERIWTATIAYCATKS